MTLHDYKIAAPCYLLYRDGHLCTDCVGRAVPTPAVRHRCVAGSRAASALCAAEQTMHRPLYRRLVDRFIVPSEYAKRVFVQALQTRSDAVAVVPHGITIPSRRTKGSGRVIFVGRLAREKGVSEMLEAWREARLPQPWTLTVAGEGPLRPAKPPSPDSIEFVGHLSRSAVAQTVATAEVALVPSLSPETFSLSAAEAMAAGCCVIASRIGNLPGLVGDAGVLVPPGDVAQFTNALRRVAEDGNLRAHLGRAARRRVEENLTEGGMLEGTLDVYEQALTVSARGQLRPIAAA